MSHARLHAGRFDRSTDFGKVRRRGSPSPRPSARRGAKRARAPAGGTVRWGLRTGHAAWPNRSTPASAVREFSLNGSCLSLPRIWGLGMPPLPHFGPLILADGFLREFEVGPDGFQVNRISFDLRFCRLDRLGGRTWTGGSGSLLQHHRHGTPPRASRVEPGR